MLFDKPDFLTDEQWHIYRRGVFISFMLTALFYPILFPSPQKGFLNACAHTFIGICIGYITCWVWPLSLAVVLITGWSKAVFAAMA